MHLYQIGAYVCLFISQTLTLEPMTRVHSTWTNKIFAQLSFFGKSCFLEPWFPKNLYLKKGFEDDPTWGNGTMVH